MATATMSSSPITQVSQNQVPTHHNLSPQLLTRLHLDLRGKRFEVDRETIMNLPESVLLCLFPNGLVLSRQMDGTDGEDEEEVYAVDVCSALLTIDLVILTSRSVRPRLLQLRFIFLSRGVRKLLWHGRPTGAVCCPTTPPRERPVTRIRAKPEPSHFEAGYHCAARGTRVF